MTRRSPSLLRLRSSLVLALAALACAAHADVPAAWQGRLEVLRVEGRGCGPDLQAPFTRQVQAVRQPDGWLLWGRMQTARLRAQAPGASGHVLEFLDPSGGGGAATVAAGPDAVTGEWRERADPAGGGCTFALARLHLEPVRDAAQAAASTALASYLQSLHAAQTGVLAAANRAEARPHAQVLQRLASQLPAPGDADQSIAQAFLDAAEHLSLLRERGLARQLAAVAATGYRRIADRAPEMTALALTSQARLMRRADRAGAAGLVDEALALLARAGRLDTSAGASVLNQQGMWRRNAGDLPGALESFGRAVLAEERRNAEPFELALALNNLGITLRDTGDVARARQCLERALVLAQGYEGDQARLADVIRGHLDTLEERNRGGQQHT